MYQYNKVVIEFEWRLYYLAWVKFGCGQTAYDESGRLGRNVGRPACLS